MPPSDKQQPPFIDGVEVVGLNSSTDTTEVERPDGLTDEDWENFKKLKDIDLSTLSLEVRLLDYEKWLEYQDSPNKFKVLYGKSSLTDR